MTRCPACDKTDCRGLCDPDDVAARGEPPTCACGQPSVGYDDGGYVCAECYLNAAELAHAAATAEAALERATVPVADDTTDGTETDYPW